MEQLEVMTQKSLGKNCKFLIIMLEVHFGIVYKTYVLDN